MAKPDVLVMGSYPKGDLDALENTFTVHRYWEAADKAALLAALAPKLEAIATRGDLGVPNDVMKALPKLKVISVYGVGLDAVDLNLARQLGIAVTNTPNVLNDDVADLALGLMLAVARRIPAGEAHVRSGAWASQSFPLVTRMSGKRLGILGLGGIGKAIAKRAQAFDMSIAYHGRTKQEGQTFTYYPTAAELAANSDFLVAIVTGGAGTAKLVNAEVLKALGPKGYFINVARGSVADEEALLAALESRSIAGAGLDVYLNEPKIDPRFSKLDNVVLQPHQGSGTVETRAVMGELMRNNIIAHFAGKPLLTPVG
ncbi:MAG: 2-hydroxyacid dehydrogenase [Aestuariivirga sp.]